MIEFCGDPNTVISLDKKLEDDNVTRGALTALLNLLENVSESGATVNLVELDRTTLKSSKTDHFLFMVQRKKKFQNSKNARNAHRKDQPTHRGIPIYI